MNASMNLVDVQYATNMLIAFVPRIIAAAAVLLIFWILFRATRTALVKMLTRAGFHAALVGLVVDNVYRFTLALFAVVMAASQLGINVGTVLAGIGVVGIAVGLAAQDTVANMIAGFLIFWDKPFKVGDFLSIGDLYGEVREITIRTTRIRTQSNTYVVIPNRKIIDDVLVNHSMYGETRVNVPIGIAYKEYIPQARTALLEAAKSVEGVSAQPAPDVVVRELGGSSVDLAVRVWVDDASHERPIFHRTLEACKLALDAAGIQIPYPHLQLFVENVEPRVWEQVAALPRLQSAVPKDLS